VGDKTGISWADATYNPITGCTHLSAGCDNCYSAGLTAGRLSSLPAYAGLAIKTSTGPRFTGETRTLPDRLSQPLRWKRPRRIFVNSMSDLFERSVPVEFIVQVFDVMCNADWHIFQVLTKRPQRMAEFVAKYVSGEYGEKGRTPIRVLPPHIWLGTSIENDRYAWRADHIRHLPAKVRFISAEPLLGSLPSLDLTRISWVIVGGESGPRSRPMHPDWARDLRYRCDAAGVAFWFKQKGEWTWEVGDDIDREPDAYLAADGSVASEAEAEADRTRSWNGIWKVGKHYPGHNQLDGETLETFPT
jgi:protein gp37